MKQMDKNPKIWIGAIAGLAVVLIIAMIFIFRQRSQMNELVQQFDIQKEDLEDEYSQLAIQYEGYKFEVNNDSLIIQFENEKMKVQRLLEELRTVKSSNANRINELKKELATVRAVLKTYVIQIDSLNKLNQKLERENKVVTQKYREVSHTATQLKKEKEKLSEQVTIASKLDAVGIQVEPIDKRGKKATKISKTEQLKICFSIAKNVTASTGEKYVYVRIVKPDGDVLVKNRANVFPYENKEINYSSRKMIDYTGEEMSECIYWQIEEFLYPGDYRVDIFADNYLIGSKSFSLKK